MTTKHRVLVTSMWSFEDVAIQELQKSFNDGHPEYDFACEYSKADHVIRVTANQEDTAISFANLVSKFIEEQKNKDLLDAPRIRQLDIATVLNDEGDLVETTPEKEPTEKLVVVENEFDQDVISQSLTHTTKHWVSSDGGLGCFARANREILHAIAAVTGTDISISEDMRSLKVPGSNTGDVDDALAKLSRIEVPLSIPRNVRTSNMVMVPHDSNLRVRIVYYTCLSEGALDRVLMDTTNLSIPLSEMFATVSLVFDPETHTFNVPKNLLNPPSISNEPGKSRIWNDFNFQEIGRGEEFISLESIVEKNMGVAAPGVSLPHPYLTADKAKQVNQWVSEGAGLADSAPDCEPSLRSQPDTESASKTDSNAASRPPPVHETKGPALAIKKPRGVKTRIPMPAANSQSELSAGSAAAASAKVSGSPSPNANSDTPTSTQRVWKTDCEWQPAQPTAASQAKIVPPVSDTGSKATAGSFDRAVWPQTPEGKPWPSSSFDATKYGLNKTPSSAGTPIKSGSRIQRPGAHQRTTPKSKYEKRNDLIDVFAPVTCIQANARPPLTFDQPALVPQNMPDNFENFNGSPVQKRRLESTAMQSHDSIGMEFGSDRMAVEPNGTGSDSESKIPTPDSGKDETRLLALKKAREEIERAVTIPSEVTTNISPAQCRSQANELLLREILEQIAESHRPAERLSNDESTTREFYRTMQHRASSPCGQPMNKAEKRAIRQATLENAWGFPRVGSTCSVADLPEDAASAAGKENLQSHTTGSKHEETALSAAVKNKAESHMEGSIKTLFEALKPNLDAAEFFHGALSLEAQFGLILVPRRPKTYHGGMISLDEWTNIFRSQKGLPAPTTKFISRLTTTGSDVDQIVDLKTSESDPKRRLFEQEYTEYSISYEYHCRTKDDHEFIIAIDEQGKYTIREPTALLGAVNLHFPKQIWDGRVVVTGTSEHVPGSDPELEKAVQHLIDHLWIQPDRSLIRIFTKLPKGNMFVIEKVYMKRWTRHRHVRPGEAPSNNNAVESDKESVAVKSDCIGNQDLFLQITEVQDLFIGICPSDPQAIRARAVGPAEMIRTGRQWYEVSLISPAIEDLLKSNASMEVGERTEDWRSSDLLGKDASLLSPFATTPVSSAVGPAGIGELLRLTQTVVEKLDGVGYWNGWVAPESLHPPPVAPDQPTTTPERSPSPGREAEPDQKALDEIESKEVGSIAAPTLAPAPETEGGPVSVALLSTVQGDGAPGVKYW